MSVSFYVFDTVSGEIVSDELNVHNTNAALILQLAGIPKDDIDGEDLTGFLAPVAAYRAADLLETLPANLTHRSASDETGEQGAREIDFGTNPAVFAGYAPLLREIARTAEFYETEITYQ